MRYLVAGIFLAVCLTGLWTSVRTGQARLLINGRKDAYLLARTDKALRLSPSDPEVHYARAMVFWRMERMDQSVAEYEEVVRLRPRDYVPWMDLGSAREQTGDFEGALSAMENAVRLAPHYGLPRWELGTLLLRMGRPDEAFSELRAAVVNNPHLLPDLMDIAWEEFEADASAVRQAIQPESNAARVSLGTYFLERGKMDAALELFREAGGEAAWQRHAHMVQLIEKRRYADAAKLWRLSDNATGDTAVNDGSFELGQFSDAAGFVWQIIPQPDGTRILLDKKVALTGSNSLRLDFGGSSDASQFVMQLILANGGARYQLTFSVRTEDLVSGALPTVSVQEAAHGGQLAVADGMPSGTSEWQSRTLTFEIHPDTEAVYLMIRRQQCPDETCPIYGRVWFDDFALRKVADPKPAQGEQSFVSHR